MCGIAGGMTKSGAPPDVTILNKMQAALKHRGPDGEGHFVQDRTALAHTRLAIVDVDGGRQPFVSEAGVALVANGEIYNDLELRRSIDPAAYQSDSDNESILHLYLQHGLSFTAQLRGMYAVALYDARDHTLVLARDPFGIKPLYYLETPGAFWFASEPQAFRSAGVLQPQERASVRDQLLGLQYTCGEQSIFTGVQRVAPGETIVIQDGLVKKRQRLPSLSSSPAPRTSVPGDFEKKWMEAVDVHRRCDVPYGIFLSGGTDSAAVLAAMAALEDRPVIAYTAGFSGGAVHDERERAAAMAQSVGADHRCIEVTAADFWQSLPAIANTMDDPVADYATIPTYLLAQTAARDVKVVLTGEGGDEVLGGYGRYRAACRPWLFRKRPWSRHALARTGVLRQDADGWRSHISTAEDKAKTHAWSRLQQAQALDIKYWLPNDLLTKVDRCLMAHGLEGRVPFLDGPFARFAFDLPDADKVQGRLSKMILRRWLDKALPSSDPFARKRGFSVPVGAWISAKAEELAPLVSEQPGVMAACDPGAVTHLFKSLTPATSFSAWILLFYALWHQCHIIGTNHIGSVQDVLAQKS